MHLGHAARCQTSSMALRVVSVGVVDAGATGALDLAADRAWLTAKAFCNGPDGALVIAHGHEHSALLCR